LFGPAIFLLHFNYLAQSHVGDSLRLALKKAGQDTNKVNTLNMLAWELGNSNLDTAIVLSTQALTLTQKLNWKKGEAMAERQNGWFWLLKNDHERAMGCFNKALNICELLIAAGDTKTVREGQVIKGRTISNIAGIYSMQSKFEEALSYYLKSLKISEEAGDKQTVGRTFSNIAKIYYSTSDYPKALDYYLKGLIISEGAGDKINVGRALGSIANVYFNQSDYPKALEYYFKGLKISEELGDKSQLGYAFSNIAGVFRDQADFPKALEYYFKSLKISEEVGNKILVGSILGNIAIVYYNKGDYPKALEYYFKSLRISEEVGGKLQMGIALCNIGIVYDKQANYPKALEYYFKGLKISEEISDNLQIGRTLGAIGISYLNAGKYKEAELYLKKALVISQSIGAGILEKEHQQTLTTLYEKTNRPALALQHYKKFIALRDSIYSLENSKKLMRSEMDRDYEKKTQELKFEQDKKDIQANEEKEKQKIITYSVSAGLVLVLILVFFVFRGYRQKQKDNLIITQQKHEVEESKKEIIDSIHYAKRIQSALMPSVKQIEKNLNRLQNKG
jgi:tetratricopeptide (TPR) repeat protein